LQWVTRLEEALSEDRLRVFSQTAQALSQPASGYVYREFLLRLITDAGDLVLPSTFIPPAERYQTMSRVDRWMLAKAVELLAGDARDDKHIYAVNLSAQSLADEHFLGDTAELLKQHDDLTPHLCFEITETAAISNWRQAVRFMEQLQELGCRFAIDDFGSGMTSFPYLRQLAVDFVKIDGTIVSDISSDPIDHTMVDTINKIAHELGMLTIAEYVESERVLDAVRDLGVDFAQGFLFERPQPWIESSHPNDDPDARDVSKASQP
jgi:Amt family ammonium transporter